MGISHATASQEHPTTAAGAVEALRLAGHRITTPRRAICEILFDGQGHRSADEVVAALGATHPGINRSTVYRTLDELERLSVIVHTHLGHGPASYHVAAHAHFHLVCEVCGETTSIEPSLLDDLVAEVHASFGFTVHPLHSSLLGTCAACRAGAK